MTDDWITVKGDVKLKPGGSEWAEGEYMRVVGWQGERPIIELRDGMRFLGDELEEVPLPCGRTNSSIAIINIVFMVLAVLLVLVCIYLGWRLV